MRRSADEWQWLRDLVSPSFFEILPANDLRRQIAELAANGLRRREREAARRAVSSHLADAGVPIRLVAAPEHGAMTARHRGALVLQLFFRQLYHLETTLLDLRAGRFQPGGEVLYWSPRPLWIRWDSAFLAHLREVYAGFYERDSQRFRHGLAGLGVQRAEQAFRATFARGPTNALSFELRTFRSAFHEVFEQCRNGGARLHPNFIPLGIYLACLVQHLEQLGGPHDVVGAYRASRD